MLIENCPSCRAPLGWGQPSVHTCPSCTADLRKADSDYVPDSWRPVLTQAMRLATVERQDLGAEIALHEDLGSLSPVEVFQLAVVCGRALKPPRSGQKLQKDEGWSYLSLAAGMELVMGYPASVHALTEAAALNALKPVFFRRMEVAAEARGGDLRKVMIAMSAMDPKVPGIVRLRNIRQSNNLLSTTELARALRVENASVGLAEGAVMAGQLEPAPAMPPQAGGQEDAPPPPMGLDPKVMAALRADLDFSDFHARNSAEFDAAMASDLAAFDDPKDVALVEAAWTDARRKLAEDPTALPFLVAQHDIDGERLIIVHRPSGSYVAYRGDPTAIDDCTMWKVRLIFTVIGGAIDAFTGVGSALGDKAIVLIGRMLNRMAEHMREGVTKLVEAVHRSGFLLCGDDERFPQVALGGHRRVARQVARQRDDVAVQRGVVGQRRPERRLDLADLHTSKRVDEELGLVSPRFGPPSIL